MSSFFTTPASQKKRKREDGLNAQSSPKKKKVAHGAVNSKPLNRKTARDESVSGSGSEDDEILRNANDDDEIPSSESESEDETGAERRLRLAEQYLENIKGETETVGFDAEEIDRDLIAERLKEDAAATKGRLYRHIASSHDFSSAVKTFFRADTQTTTAVAVCPPYAYTVSKDITLIKWELPTPTKPPPQKEKKKATAKPPPPARRRPTKLLYTRGNKNETRNPKYQHHTADILTVAASSDGKYVATGGADKRLIIWSAADLKPLRIFTQHRDAVTSLAFRRGTNQLYSSSKDRTIKTWSLDELGYMETLFGHQDEVVDIAALSLEQCVSVGARDRTARLWKVVEESQLVFRGGGTSDKRKLNPRVGLTNGEMATVRTSYAEGSIDRVAMIDEETFVTGSDNGSISLWSLHKKKPVFTVPVAHGLDPALRPEEASAEEVPNSKVPGAPQPRWITALATVPYSDLILSGSWDGRLRAWKISEDKKRLEVVGVLGEAHAEAERDDNVNVLETRDGEPPEDRETSVRGIINDIEIFERGDRGKDGLCVVIATGKEHRLGRWKSLQGKNGACIFEVPHKQAGEPATMGSKWADTDSSQNQSKT
ncbi:pre-rRNA processing protein [Xanthoria calcicola]